MEDNQLVEAQQQLVIKAAEEVRQAIITRARMVSGPLAEYDEAVKSGDRDKILVASIVLTMCAGIGDPVVEVINRFGEVMRLLKEISEGE